MNQSLSGAGQQSMACTPSHPGEILKDELADLALSAAGLARQFEVPANRVTQTP